MAKSAIIIDSQHALSKFIGDIREQWNKAKYLRVTVKTGRDRSLDQNAISHAWYQQIAQELREDAPGRVKCICKLTYGVPILRAESEAFRALYDKAILRVLSYEEKVQAMELLPVTSLMTVPQLSQYLVDMQNGYAMRGVILEFPPEAPNPKIKRTPARN